MTFRNLAALLTALAIVISCNLDTTPPNELPHFSPAWKLMSIDSQPLPDTLALVLENSGQHYFSGVANDPARVLWREAGRQPHHREHLERRLHDGGSSRRIAPMALRPRHEFRAVIRTPPLT